MNAHWWQLLKSHHQMKLNDWLKISIKCNPTNSLISIWNFALFRRYKSFDRKKLLFITIPIYVIVSNGNRLIEKYNFFFFDFFFDTHALFVWPQQSVEFYYCRRPLPQKWKSPCNTSNKKQRKTIIKFGKSKHECRRKAKMKWYFLGR